MTTLEPLAFGLVLVSALMHAGWNLIAKLGSDRLVAMALMKAPNMVVSATALAIVGLPAGPSWPYVLASASVNCLYFYFLINAYRVGDLSLAYPVSRGLAPLMVLALSAVAASELPTLQGVLGVALISAGIVTVAARRGATRKHYATLLWAGGVAVTIAVYTVIDGLGGRLSGNAVGYVAVLNILTGIAVCGTAVVRRGQVLGTALRQHWRNGLAGGTLMLGAYMIVVHAMTLAPMAQVAALRETSVIFAALLGVIFLREPFGARRVVSSAVVAVGIALLALGGR